MSATYDPVRLIGDVQAILRHAGVDAPARPRNLPAAMDAARALLGALDVAGPAVAQPTTRCVTWYRMALVDVPANVVVEQARARNRTEVGLVASRWRGDDTRSRIDITPVSVLVPAYPGAAAR